MLLSVTVDNDIKFQIAALAATNADFPAKLSAIVRKNALDVLANAKNLVPVSTGALSRSLMASFFNGGFSATIGSYLPYAPRQEFDETLDHTVRESRTRKENTKSGKVGSIIKGTSQSNPNATFGFLRKSLAVVSGFFNSDCQALCDSFGRAWEDGEL